MAGVIEASSIAPSRITLEIPEGSNFLEHNAALSVLHCVKDLGVRLALDDVGSAYSSLLRLKGLPIDEIKLDQGVARYRQAHAHGAVTGISSPASDQGTFHQAMTNLPPRFSKPASEKAPSFFRCEKSPAPPPGCSAPARATPIAHTEDSGPGSTPALAPP